MDRLKSMHLMQALTPFTQSGILPPQKATLIASEAISGNYKTLREFIDNPDMPMAYQGIINNILRIIQ